jgi:hypothetical protein
MSGSPSRSRSCPGSPRLEECRRLTFPTFMEAVTPMFPRATRGLSAVWPTPRVSWRPNHFGPTSRSRLPSSSWPSPKSGKEWATLLANFVPATRPRRPSLPAGPTNHSRASSSCRSRVTLHSWLPLPSKRSLLCGNLQHGVLVIELLDAVDVGAPRPKRSARASGAGTTHPWHSFLLQPSGGPGAVGGTSAGSVRYSPLSRCTSAS